MALLEEGTEMAQAKTKATKAKKTETEEQRAGARPPKRSWTHPGIEGS
jgi:hypothetical protein